VSARSVEVHIESHGEEHEYSSRLMTFEPDILVGQWARLVKDGQTICQGRVVRIVQNFANGRVMSELQLVERRDARSVLRTAYPHWWLKEQLYAAARWQVYWMVKRSERHVRKVKATLQTPAARRRTNAHSPWALMDGVACPRLAPPRRA